MHVSVVNKMQKQKWVDVPLKTFSIKPCLSYTVTRDEGVVNELTNE